MRRLLSLLAGLTLAQAAQAAQAAAAPLPAGVKYVAMGSSYASGPGVTTSADTPPNRCSRSADNYAHQLARKRGLNLLDVSCGGAMTGNLLGPWGALPPQLDAVDAATRLVTVTIGGNDLGYVGGLMAGSCEEIARKAGSPAKCLQIKPPTDEAFDQVEVNLRKIAAEVRRRAPDARLVFVDYPTVLPPSGACAAAPLSAAQADASRAIARRLAEITARVAHETGADLLAASKLTQDHGACAADPWMNGYPAPHGAPYHPNLAGMTAVAQALDRLLAH